MAASPTLDLRTDEIMVFGEHAVARGNYSVSLAPEGAEPVALAGSYITHFARANGEWKINTVLSNYNAAPPPGAVPPAAADDEQPPPDEGTMRELGDAYASLLAAGDWAGLAALHTEDAVVAFSNTLPLQGRSAVQTHLAENWTGTSPTIEIHDVATLELDADWALDGGWYTLNATTPEGAIVQGGTYLSLLRRQADGSWKIHWSVINGQPVPAA
jgi:uncharacterized protein (TIGR02246 family)